MANGGRAMEIMRDFIFLGCKITDDGDDCNHDIKWCLLLGRKAVTDLDSILKKQRHYFTNNIPPTQRYVFFSSQLWMKEIKCGLKKLKTT